MSSGAIKGSHRRSVKGALSSLDTSHPLLTWFVRQITFGATYRADGNFVMGGFAAKRFSLGISDEGRVVLGFLESDEDLMESVTWRAVGFVRKTSGYDWVVLGGVLTGSEADVRLWLPVESGKLNGFSPYADGEDVELIPTRIVNGVPLPLTTEPFAIAKLSKKGDWEQQTPVANTSQNFFASDEDD